MYILKETNPTCFGLFMLVYPTFDLKKSCGVWKILGDFQMRVYINYPLQNRKLGLVVGKW